MLRPLLLGAALIAAAPVSLADDPIWGFTPDAARVEREWEMRFAAIPSADSARSYMRRLSGQPHHLGSPGGRANAEWIRDQFRAWGWTAEIEVFHVLFPVPKLRRLELLGPKGYVAKLQEPAIPGDTTTSQRGQLPTYNAYSIDGDVTAPLVYVNYGVPADYERLQRLGISVKGAIVIAKYGQSWRGIKPKVAAEHGAIGCILYSDPADDGYHAGDAYPRGGMRPSEGVQRGSVMDMPVRTGDPLTPNVGATDSARRLDRSEVETLTRIPVLPISWSDAQPLLQAIGGRVAPREWQGGLPFTYHVGPGPGRVRLALQFDWQLAPAYDVIARLPGNVEPGLWVVRGNHHDAWVNGAADPVSGLVAELEEARALGAMYRDGWRPRRTIVYAAWDGEEPILLGSTEWAEQHASELQASAVAYLNSDVNERGFLDLSGSHVLERLLNQVANTVADPETGLTVGRRARLARIANSADPARAELRGRPDLRLDALGSGSDFTPFLQHLGIASANLGFGGEEPGSGGVYHSIYDTFTWYGRFSDSSFSYGRALALVTGLSVMRLASADVVPYQFGALADAVEGYTSEVKQLLASKGDAARERNRQLDEGVFQATRDPRSPETAPPRDSVPPFLNFAPLDNAIASLRAAAARYDSVAAARFGTNASLGGGGLAELNAALVQVERALTEPAGLPGRPWYRHTIYAPGLYTGYGVKTLPGVRESIEQGQWIAAEAQVEVVASALQRAAGRITAASGMLEELR
jgi:N-acetylated-alpha-linked acidic dipeptidase